MESVFEGRFVVRVQRLGELVQWSHLFVAPASERPCYERDSVRQIFIGKVAVDVTETWVCVNVDPVICQLIDLQFQHVGTLSSQDWIENVSPTPAPEQQGVDVFITDPALTL